MASIADDSGADFLRLENLDVDIPPDAEAILRTQHAAGVDADNGYLPFVGQRRLRNEAAAHVSRIAGVPYSGERNCVSDFGIDGETMSRRLLDHGVCATAMTGWGETHGAQYIRFVFANEPVQRLELLGARVRKALSI